jgi:predicted DNA-binding protein
MAKTRTNTLRMPPETKAKLQQMAREQAATQRREVKWTDIVRAAIDKMLKEYAGQTGDGPPTVDTVPS